MCLPSTSLQELINDVRAQQRSRKTREPSTATIVDFAIHDPTVDFKQASFRDSSPELGLVGVLSGPVRSHSCSEQCRLLQLFQTKSLDTLSTNDEFIPHLRNLLLYHVVSGQLSL
jgi:hypothetical protein